MILKVTIYPEIPPEFRTNNLGSILHGALMELLPSEIAEELHSSSAYSPLKQRLIINRQKEVRWEIVSLSKNLNKALNDIFKECSEIQLKHHRVTINIKSMVIEKIDEVQMIKETFEKKEFQRFRTINICTPMSFKSKGSYDIFPDLRKFFRSIMVTFDNFYSDYQLYDTETLDYLLENVRIVDYRLHTSRFHLEGTRIPSFVGEIKFRITGPLPMQQLIYLLLNFGELFGVGIKTSLGMGKFELK